MAKPAIPPAVPSNSIRFGEEGIEWREFYREPINFSISRCQRDDQVLMPEDRATVQSFVHGIDSPQFGLLICRDLVPRIV
jgi:hypothetical protein